VFAGCFAVKCNLGFCAVGDLILAHVEGNIKHRLMAIRQARGRDIHHPAVGQEHIQALFSGSISQVQDNESSLFQTANVSSLKMSYLSPC